MDGAAALDVAALVAERAGEYLQSPEFAAMRAEMIVERLGLAILNCAGIDRVATMTTLCAVLEEIGAGSPDLAAFMAGSREDASWWAECASQIEIESHVAAGLRQIENRAWGERARKRLLVSLWGTLTEDDKRAFLRSVDPQGKFSRKPA